MLAGVADLDTVELLCVAILSRGYNTRTKTRAWRRPQIMLPASWHEPDSAPPDVQDACAICLETLCDPTRLCCGHVFCRICAYRALRLGGSCPMCRDTATARPTLPADLLLDTETEQRLASRYSTAEMQARKAAMAATLPSPTGHGAEVVEEIPRGWIRKVSREGIPYYFNPHTRQFEPD